jgi:competence protein ComEA
MKLSVWKMGPNRINEKSAGLLLLLLIVVAIFFLRGLSIHPGVADVPCPHPIFVQVEGDVRHPGAYAFCSSPNLEELIQKAGGLRHVPSGVVANRTLGEGTKVTLNFDGKRYEIRESEMSPFHKITLGLPISLNRESEEGLTAVPGIGQRLARRIVAERANRGGFKELDELRSVPGIGQELYAKIKPYLTL